MDDENIVPTPAEEVKDSEPQPEPHREEGEAVAEPQQVEQRYADEEVKKQPDSVPLHVHKETRDKLKSEIRDLREKLAQANPSQASLDKIATTWGVDPSTVKELAQAIKEESTKEVEARFGSIVQEQKKAKVEQAFNDEFSKVLKDYPQLEGKKEALKALAFTPQYVKTPLNEIAQSVFADFLGKGTLEESRPATDRGGETVDFSKPMTPEQKRQVLDDPKARSAYYSYLDQNSPLAR